MPKLVPKLVPKLGPKLRPKLRAVTTTVSARAGSIRAGSIRAGSIRGGSIRAGSLRGGSRESFRGGSIELPRRRPTRAAGHKLAHESVVARREGRVEDAVTLAGEAVAAFRAADDKRGEALALNTLALALAQERRYAEAVDALDGAITLLGELGDRHREGTVLVNLGTLHRQAGGVESARFCWRKALERLDPASPESHETERLLRAS